MVFSIIVPSFNQESFIANTLKNLTELKQIAFERGIKIEILLFDAESEAPVQKIINDFKEGLDYLEIKKDKGQYDAINKGLQKLTGTYWSWLNTDDLIDAKGFFKLVEILKNENSIDYIYGGVNYMDENGKIINSVSAFPLNVNKLISQQPAIFQPGSFFKTEFTRKLGLIDSYRCCFDYEFVLRCLKNGARIHSCNFPVSAFRYYKQSKTGSITPVFIKEQLIISKLYGRKWYNYLSWFLQLRLLKHFLFPRK